MNQRICTVEEGQSRLVTIREPMLNVVFCYWEQGAEKAEMLELQYPDPILLRRLPDTGFRKYGRGHDLRHSIEEICNDPVKHLNQEGEFLQYPAVEMTREV